MYCESYSSTKKLGELFKEKESSLDKIGVDWSETWVNDQGKEITIECCFDVDTPKKASNLVGALLLGLKTHKNFPKDHVYCINEVDGDFDMKDWMYEEDWSKLSKDFHHISTRVKYLS